LQLVNENYFIQILRKGNDMSYGICNDTDVVIAKFVVPTTMKMNRPYFISDTLSLKRYASSREAYRWEIESNIEPLSSNANELMKLLITRQISETLRVAIPQNVAAENMLSIGSDTISLPATGAIGTSNITIRGLGINHIIPLGYFISLSNATRTVVYMINSVVKGTGADYNIEIFPPLRHSDYNSIKIKNVIMDCYLDTDAVRGMVYTDGILMTTGTLKLLEAIV
jgi:hypothetical protein